jgi:hypothetical protein
MPSGILIVPRRQISIELGRLQIAERRMQALLVIDLLQTTWTLKAVEGDRSYNVVVVGSLGVIVAARLIGNTEYPEIADDYARTFRTLNTRSYDVFLANHGVFYGLKEKYSKLAKGGPNPLVDSQGYREYLKRAESFRGQARTTKKMAP